MLEKRYLKQLYQSFKSTGGYIIGIIGGICSIISFLYKDDLGINPTLVIFGTIITIIIISFFDLSIKFYNETLNTSPEVYKVIHREKATILLTEYSNLLQVQGLVTIYYLNDKFEEFIGYGEVINIQNDKKIQIDIKRKSSNTMNLEEIRKSLIIKPFVTSKTIE